MIVLTMVLGLLLPAGDGAVLRQVLEPPTRSPSAMGPSSRD